MDTISNITFPSGKCRGMYKSGPNKGLRCIYDTVGETKFCKLHKDSTLQDFNYPHTIKITNNSLQIVGAYYGYVNHSKISSFLIKVLKPNESCNIRIPNSPIKITYYTRPADLHDSQYPLSYYWLGYSKWMDRAVSCKHLSTDIIKDNNTHKFIKPIKHTLNIKCDREMNHKLILYKCDIGGSNVMGQLKEKISFPVRNFKISEKYDYYVLLRNHITRNLAIDTPISKSDIAQHLVRHINLVHLHNHETHVRTNITISFKEFTSSKLLIKRGRDNKAEIVLYWINNISLRLIEGSASGEQSISTSIGHEFLIYIKNDITTNMNRYNQEIYDKYCIKQIRITNKKHNITIDSNDIISKLLRNIETLPNTDEWKKPCIKSVSLLRNIKKLTSNDTIKEMCDCEEYIEFPKELTIRDFQEGGAAYTYEYSDSD